MVKLGNWVKQVETSINQAILQQKALGKVPILNWQAQPWLIWVCLIRFLYKPG
jgi:hypothetical protein